MDIKQTPKPLIVFDLVATLTDAGPRYAQAFENVCRHYGVEPPARKDILRSLGNKNLKQIIEDYIPELADREIPAFMDSCNSVCDSMLHDQLWREDLFLHVREVLSDLKEQDFLLGIYTGTRREALEEQLAYHQIGRFFEDDFVRAKDNEKDGFVDSCSLKRTQIASIVDAYRGYLRGTGSDYGDETVRKNVIVIGDSVSDYKASYDAGLSFLGFAPTPAKQHAFAATGVTEIFGNYRSLHTLLERHFTPWADDNMPADNRNFSLK